MITFKTDSYENTMDFGKRLAALLPNGSVVCMSGDLGAGKTTTVRGIAQGLHIKEIVQSPTFNIMKIYLKGDRPLIHIDAYRLADIDTDIGLEEYIGYETGITVIEWPMFIEKYIPEDAIRIEILRSGDEERTINITGPDEQFLRSLL